MFWRKKRVEGPAAPGPPYTIERMIAEGVTLPELTGLELLALYQYTGVAAGNIFYIIHEEISNRLQHKRTEGE